MLKGDMCLKVMEKGEPKNIPIREGEVSVSAGVEIHLQKVIFKKLALQEILPGY